MKTGVEMAKSRLTPAPKHGILSGIAYAVQSFGALAAGSLPQLRVSHGEIGDDWKAVGRDLRVAAKKRSAA